MNRLTSIACMLLALSAVTAHSAVPKGMGLGLIFGSPTGFSIKNWYDGQRAWDGAVGTSGGDFDLHIDHLWHDFKLISALKDESASPPAPKKWKGDTSFYFGIGGRLKAAGKTEIGVRGVMGIALLLDRSPFEMFLELAPILRFTPDTGLNFDGGLGFRYYMGK